jgi:hypothetical protein
LSSRRSPGLELRVDRNEELRGSGIARRKSRFEIASDQGVWIAALYLSIVASLMPVWFLGASLAITAGAPDASASSVSERGTRIILLALGTVATWFAIRVAIVLSRAPRLGRGHHRKTMRYGAVAAGALSIVLLARFVYADGPLGGDALAFIGALAPAVLMAELSFALPAITKGRHGAAIGTLGGYLWAFASIAMLCLGAVPAVWWVPFVFAIGGSCCTAPAALRVWRHYEQEPLTA